MKRIMAGISFLVVVTLGFGGQALAGPAPMTAGGLSCRTWIDGSSGGARCDNGDSRTWYVRLGLDCEAPTPDATSDWIAIRAGRSATLAATCGSGSVIDLRLDRR